MIPYELQHLSLMQIDIFLRCAEQMNFTKVAQDLHITPGMVSKKIAAMEESLGFALFRREKNRVMLTPEGEALYAAWRQPVKTMVRQVREIQGRSKQNQALVFSLCETNNLERFFVPLISAYSAENDTMFRIKIHNGFDDLDDILAGKSDIFFVPKFAERGIRQLDELDYFLALPSPLFVAMSAENPLSKKKILQVEDLERTSVLISEETISWYTDMLQELFRNHEVPLNLLIQEENAFRTNYLHMAPDHVFITDKYYHAFASNAVEYRELVGTESGLLMVYRKDAPQHVQQFVEFARRFYKELR